MKIILSGRNISITESLRSRWRKRSKSLKDILDQRQKPKLPSPLKNRHIIEVTIPLTGMYYAEKNPPTICMLQ